MRIIEFRIWDKEQNCWYAPIFRGYENKIYELLLTTSGEIIMRTEDKLKHQSMFPDRYELSQYTGFTDESGNQVYEGDVLMVTHMLIETVLPYRAEVVWDKYRFALRSLEIERSFYPYQNADPFGLKLEIIGNRFENPNLIGG